MEQEKVKEAFSKIKEDIFNLGKEILDIKSELLELSRLMKQINEDIIKLKLEKIAEKSGETPSEIPPKVYLGTLKNPTNTSTDNEKNPTHLVISTQNPTHPQEIEGWKTQNLGISIGNEGVPTDRQTDRQTIRHIFRQVISKDFVPKNIQLVTTKQERIAEKSPIVVTNNLASQNRQNDFFFKEKPFKQQISEASEILDSLDSIKKEIRKKFKKITKQELLIFSTIYTLEEQDPDGVDYRKVALKLHLSESSIRDYAQRIISKGIPITKEKVNNKKILLHIAPELKKIASLDTIIKLREI